VLKLLQGLQHGALALHLPDGSVHLAGQGPTRISVQVHDWRVFSRTLRSGDIGFGEAWIAGEWHTDQLLPLLELLLANRARLSQAVYGSLIGRMLHRLQHALNRNSRRGSRRNIHAHYDLGNPFYRLWLDETLSYSAAWFGGDTGRSLQAAQQAKMRRALRQCQLQPGQRLLEIGCGWGALAECAATEFGARVEGITLSHEQLAAAQERIAAAGLTETVKLVLRDWRESGLDEAFDAIVSIEMFEAVGRAWWPEFFARLKRRLRPGGRACLQSITIRDDLFERYAAGSDFIQQFIFPGGMLPSPSQFRAAAAQAGLRVVDEFNFGADYAETLHRWREAFLRNEGPVRAIGFDTRFLRTWDFYLAYCEAAFRRGNTDVCQFTLAHA